MMRKIEEHEIYKQRRDDFRALAECFQQTLRKLSFTGAIVYGSVIRDEFTASSFSDIDVVAYSRLFSRESSLRWVKYIEQQMGAFYDKMPIFIEDHVTARIEFSIRLGQTVFDVSVFPVELPGYAHRYTNTIHDRLDVGIGSMYLHAFLLYGSVPFEQLIWESFIPFYSDELRYARMQQLEERLWSCFNKLDVAIARGEDDLLRQIYKTRSYLIKWMFINARKYPVDYNRYLRRQLTQELGVTDDTIDCLLLKQDSLHQACLQFVKKGKAILFDAVKRGETRDE